MSPWNIANRREQCYKRSMKMVWWAPHDRRPAQHTWHSCRRWDSQCTQINSVIINDISFCIKHLNTLIKTTPYPKECAEELSAGRHHEIHHFQKQRIMWECRWEKVEVRKRGKPQFDLRFPNCNTGCQKITRQWLQNAEGKEVPSPKFTPGPAAFQL